MIRRLAICLLLLVPTAVFGSTPAAAPPAGAPGVNGVVADPTGAIVPGAQVDLVDADGSIAGSCHSGGDGSFLLVPPHAGNFTLVVSEPGFETTKTPLVIPAAASTVASASTGRFAATLRITLPIAGLSTNVQVNADASEDLTASEDNHDSSVMSSQELKSLPIFDNDYATAMSAFLDDSATATGGSGLIVDGVEANRATVSASAVQEVRINQDPYSAQYYWPGRGQMEIVTKSAADKYHGQFNFLFRNSAMNAQNALAPSKPFEQRQTYEGSATGPIFFAPKSSFLVSFNRVLFDQDAVVRATLPSPANPSGVRFSANVPAPTRDTEFSTRAAHQFGEHHSAYAEYSYEDWTGQNQGVGGQTLAAAGFNNRYHEDDFKIHVDSTLSSVLLNQISLVGEHDLSHNVNAAEAPRVNVQGYFTTGSAQNDALSTDYNLRIYDMLTWTHGRHFVKFGAGIPHLNRRGFDDNTYALGGYVFGPTLAPDGVTVLQSALENYEAGHPSGYIQNSGDVHFIYHQQEMGAFIQDQWKINDRFSITPGIRYDWQSFFAQKRLGFSPRVSFAWVVNEASKTVLRGGGGIYYDRTGSGSLLDLVRYQGLEPRRRSVTLSLNPTTQSATGCVPISQCIDIATAPVARVEFDPHSRIPYQIQYGLSIERQLGEKATAVVSVYSMRDVGAFRSIDVNAPTAQSGYTERPDPAYGRVRQMQSEGFLEGSGLDVSYRGRLNKYFTGFGRYTWSRYESNTDGIGFFPENQIDPNAEWSNASFDRRQRLGMYAMIHPDGVLNLSAGIFANSGRPWSVLTGTDPYGTDLFNGRPAGTSRNTENLPSYVDLDLRWGHDFAITPNKDEDAPRLGFSAGAFNLLNHPSGASIDQVQTSSDFGQVTSVNPPRRIQLGMRFEF